MKLTILSHFRQNCVSLGYNVKYLKNTKNFDIILLLKRKTANDKATGELYD